LNWAPAEASPGLSEAGATGVDRGGGPPPPSFKAVGVASVQRVPGLVGTWFSG